MVGRKNELNALLAILRGMSEEDYIALASKGLLRRARKEIAQVKFHEFRDEKAVLAVADRTVLLPASGPAQATCDCPTPGICQHILTACLHFSATEEGPSTSAPAVAPEVAAWWLQLDSRQLRQWAGAADWRHGARLAVTALPEATDGIVKFRDTTEVRLSPATSLDGVISTAPTRHLKRYVTAAVLARRREAGLAESTPPETGISLPKELLDEVKGQLVSCLRTGLSRLPRSVPPRLLILATQCRASGIYRPSRELEACAQEIQAIHQRTAQADTETLLQRLVRLHALIESILAHSADPPMDLVGSARSVYLESDSLELVGLGAYPWETPSGFHGVTTLFWDPESELGISWSDSRPKNSGDGFSPRNRFEGEGPWANSGSLETVSSSRFQLLNPRVNPLRRLSGSDQSHVDSTRPVQERDLPPAYTSWVNCRADQQRRPNLGLRQAIPLDSLVHLRPKKTAAPQWDEINQSLLWRLIDEDGETIDLVLAFIPLHAQAIQWIETHWSTPRLSIIGLYQRAPTESIHPVSVIRPGVEKTICSLGFVNVGETKTDWLKRLILRKPLHAWQPSSPSLDGRPAPVSLSPLQQMLTPLQSELLQASERGFVHARPSSDWESRLQSLTATGLISLSRSLRQAYESPSHFLQACYILNLYLDPDAD